MTGHYLYTILSIVLLSIWYKDQNCAKKGIIESKETCMQTVNIYTGVATDI